MSVIVFFIDICALPTAYYANDGLSCIEIQTYVR